MLVDRAGSGELIARALSFSLCESPLLGVLRDEKQRSHRFFIAEAAEKQRNAEAAQAKQSISDDTYRYMSRQRIQNSPTTNRSKYNMIRRDPVVHPKLQHLPPARMTESNAQQKLNALVGSVLFVLGAIFAAMVFVDRWTSLDVSFPDIWYRSRNLHVGLCVALFISGWWAHRLAQVGPQSPAESTVLFRSVRVYSKPNCELCDRALDALQIYSNLLPPIELIDISGNVDLESRHAETIPVVEIDGRIRFRGIVSEALLERLIAARRRQVQSTAEASNAKPQLVPGQTQNEYPWCLCSSAAAGKTKTRLAASIGDESATRLYASFLEDLLRRLGTRPENIVVAVTPNSDDAAAWFNPRISANSELSFQCEGHLGERIQSFFDSAFERGAEHVVLMGSDSPDLPAAVIDEAFHRLHSADVVLAPAADGGFVLVGLSRPAPNLFEDIAWSSPTTLVDAVTASTARGCKTELITPWYDIDTVSNLGTLLAMQQDSKSHAARCPATHRCLESLWPQIHAASQPAK